MIYQNGCVSVVHPLEEWLQFAFDDDAFVHVYVVAVGAAVYGPFLNLHLY